MSLPDFAREAFSLVSDTRFSIKSFPEHLNSIRIEIDIIP
jgi:hypothetical protein